MFWNFLPKNRVSESTPKNQWFISRGPWIHRLGMLLLKYLESRALAQCKDIRPGLPTIDIDAFRPILQPRRQNERPSSGLEKPDSDFRWKTDTYQISDYGHI